MNIDFFEITKTTAAFGGFALGVINLWLTVYKDYLRKPKLTACIKRAEVRAVEAGVFDIQIDIDFSAVNGPIYLKDAKFHHRNEIFDPANGIGTRTIYKIVNYPGHSYLNFPSNELAKMVPEIKKEHINFANLKIDDKEHRIVTVVDRVHLARFTDGYWSWPREKWSLTILHSGGELSIGFNFVVRDTDFKGDYCS